MKAEYLEQLMTIYDKCIVEKNKLTEKDKENILRELKFFGISRQTLFPDNVDIVCDEIKKAAYNKIQDKN